MRTIWGAEKEDSRSWVRYEAIDPGVPAQSRLSSVIVRKKKKKNVLDF